MPARSLFGGVEPPYLPDDATFRRRIAHSLNSFEALVAPFGGAPGQELGALLVVLRAASVVHQSHHWRTRGSSFYGDHLLFEKLYGESLPFIDQVAERAVGSGGRDVVCPVMQSTLVAALIRQWGQGSDDASALGFAAVSLAVERAVVASIADTKRALEVGARLSEGTDNLLQGASDKHEEFTYLLQQRVGDDYSYDAR